VKTPLFPGAPHALSNAPPIRKSGIGRCRGIETGSSLLWITSAPG
jgi:hypothetical protein